MYAISTLEDLAADRTFVDAVRSFARDLFALGLVNARDVPWIAPLTSYGADSPGAVLRLARIPQHARLDNASALRCAQLCERLDTAKE